MLTLYNDFSKGLVTTLNKEEAQKNFSQIIGLPAHVAKKKVAEMLKEQGFLIGEPKKIVHPVKFYEKGTLPLEFVSPKDVNGETHTLGLWDNETRKGDKYTYAIFKTLGAKRYMVKYPNGEYSLTISGLNKKITIPYLLKTYSDIFAVFKEDMYIPPEYTGKMTHIYIDEERNGIVTDYLGNKSEYHELSCVHLSQADYTLSIARDYMEYLLRIAVKEYN